MTGKEVADLPFEKVLEMFDPMLHKGANERGEEHNQNTTAEELHSHAVITLLKCYETAKTTNIEKFEGYLGWSLHNTFAYVIGRENCKKRAPIHNWVAYEDWHSPVYDPRAETEYHELVEEIRVRLNDSEKKVFHYLINPTPTEKHLRRPRITPEEISDSTGMPIDDTRKAYTRLQLKARKLFPKRQRQNKFSQVGQSV